jgi:hypothetical protein
MDQALNSILNNFSQKSSSLNCFNRGNLAGIAKCLALCNFHIVALKARKNESGEIELDYTENKKDYRLQEDLEERIKQVKKKFSQKEVVGIAIRCGEESNIVVIDLDDHEKFEAFYSIEKLKEEASCKS